MENWFVDMSFRHDSIQLSNLMWIPNFYMIRKFCWEFHISHEKNTACYLETQEKLPVKVK